MPETLPIPAPAQEAIASLKQRLVGALGDQLVSLIAYGSAVSGRFRASTSDVNLLIVLRDAGYAALRPVRDLVCGGQETVATDPLIVTGDELVAACEAFPLKLLELKHNYRVLHGADLLADLDIPQDRLLHRCRQEATNLTWRLRRAAVVRSEEIGLEQIVARFFPLLLSVLRGLVYLRTGEWLVSRDDVLARADGLFHIPRDALAQLLSWKKEQLQLPPDQWEEAIGDFLAAAEAVAEAAHA